MIQVAKSDIIPAVLIDKGVPEKTENCRLYDASSNDYNNGASTFTILSSIYGHESVKQKLIDDQHGKCCFCEADFTANGYGDVEHFRPKAGFTKTRTGKLIRPGYYWLAYEWTNLIFSFHVRFATSDLRKTIFHSKTKRIELKTTLSIIRSNHQHFYTLR
jgi:uncharacterized protein (TIGR02646 family)